MYGYHTYIIFSAESTRTEPNSAVVGIAAGTSSAIVLVIVVVVIVIIRRRRFASGIVKFTNMRILGYTVW